MRKIDWKKPLRTVDWATAKLVTGRQSDVYTFKSGSQRVIWVDDRVYPVDEQGRCTAYVEYPGFRERQVGDPVVENVPEEPADTICLYRRHGKWNINAFGKNGAPWAKQQVAPRSVWEEQYPGGLDRDHILVKVPVWEEQYPGGLDRDHILVKVPV